MTDRSEACSPSGGAFEAELAALADSAVRYHDNRAATAAGTAPEALLGNAFGRAAAAADAAESSARVRHAPACHKGCAWCCHQNVRVSAAEVLHLARWLRDRLPAGELRALTVHARESAARLRGMPQPQRARARIACALLDPATGACRVHEARPLLCRGQLSLSAETCRRAVESPGEHHFEPLLEALHGAGLAAMALELEFAFLGGGPVSGELTAMLAVALADPEAEARWFRGENPFPRHSEFSAHLNSRMATMLATAWAGLEGPAARGSDELRAAAESFLREVTGAQ